MQYFLLTLIWGLPFFPLNYFVDVFETLNFKSVVHFVMLLPPSSLPPQMLTRFQKSYQDSLAQNEALTKLITPKAFDSKADYEFFMVSSHAEELDPGTSSFIFRFPLSLSHYLLFRLLSSQKSLRTTRSCSRKLTGLSQGPTGFPRPSTPPLLTPRHPVMPERTQAPPFRYLSPRAPFLRS